MSSDSRRSVDPSLVGPSQPAPKAPSGSRRAAPPVSNDTKLAIDIRQLVERGDLDEARELFAGLVEAHQRRALRIAYQYSAGRFRSRRGRSRRVRQSVHAYRIVSGGVAVRGLVHKNSHQWLPRPAQGARAAGTLARSLRRGRRCSRPAVDRGRARGRKAPRRGCFHARDGHALRPRWIASTAVNGPSSCCATTATVRLGK